jgi:hypothetical protein
LNEFGTIASDATEGLRIVVRQRSRAAGPDSAWPTGRRFCPADQFR